MSTPPRIGPTATPVDPIESLWAQALRRLRAGSGASIAFGGSVENGTFRLTRFDGALSRVLEDLEITQGRGLGGRSWREQVALGVPDYSRAAEISHDYDKPVHLERMRAVVAAPVVVRSQVRGVVYAGVREAVGHGDRLLDAVTRTGRWLAAELAVEDEVRLRVARRTERLRADGAAVSERLRRTHAALRELRSTTTDAGTRDRIGDLLHDLAPRTGDGEPAGVTPREIDLLAQVATGASYAEVGRRLGLAPQTVKSAMRDLIARLGVHSRHEAVVAARRHGLLP